MEIHKHMNEIYILGQPVSKICPSESHFLPLYSLPPTLYQNLSVGPIELVMVCNFWDQVTEDSLQLSSWIVCPAEGLLTCLEDVGAALWRDPMEKNRGPLPTAVWWVTLEVDPAAPVKPSDDGTLAPCLEPWEDPEPDPCVRMKFHICVVGEWMHLNVNRY